VLIGVNKYLIIALVVAIILLVFSRMQVANEKRNVGLFKQLAGYETDQKLTIIKA